MCMASSTSRGWSRRCTGRRGRRSDLLHRLARRRRRAAGRGWPDGGRAAASTQPGAACEVRGAAVALAQRPAPTPGSGEPASRAAGERGRWRGAARRACAARRAVTTRSCSSCAARVRPRRTSPSSAGSTSATAVATTPTTLVTRRRAARRALRRSSAVARCDGRDQGAGGQPRARRVLRTLGRPHAGRPPQPLPRLAAPTCADAEASRAVAAAMGPTTARRATTGCRSCAPIPPSDPRSPSRPRASVRSHRAYSRAFSRARRLIYIEDQYFWSDLVAQDPCRGAAA